MREDIKANLASQIEAAKVFCDSEIARMKEEAKREDKLASFQTSAIDLRTLYEKFIDVGFTPEQAWELIKIIVIKGVK